MLTVSLLITTSCGTAREDLPSLNGASARVDGGKLDKCSSPRTGCECKNEGAQAPCGEVATSSGDVLRCAMGSITCEGGFWSACVPDEVVELTARDSSFAPLLLGSPAECTDNPCDPFCYDIQDDAIGLDPDGALVVDDDGITLALTTPPGSSATCTGLTVTPSVNTVTVTEIGSGGRGLEGSYYDQFSYSSGISDAWTPVGTRNDSLVEFNWGNGSPSIAGMPADHFSVRWRGYISIPEDGDYTFYTDTDDAARLWLDGALVINQWGPAPGEVASPVLTLSAGDLVAVQFDFGEYTGGAWAELKWSSANIPTQAIPNDYLVAPVGYTDVVTSDPPNVQFTATLTPAGCFTGIFEPLWAQDRLGGALIDDSGLLTLHGAEAGNVTATAYAADLSGSATISVVVDSLDDDLAPPGAVAGFAGAVTETDPMTVRYPYDDVVLPLGMRSPLFMWDDGGKAADAVKITLSAGAEFTHSAIFAESNARYQFPTEAWRAFEASAAGGAADVTFQRLFPGGLGPEVTRTIIFADAPLRGRIYYTEYAGANAAIMVAQTNSTRTAWDAMRVTGCPVCHSVASDGSFFATSDDGNPSGLHAVDADGSLPFYTDVAPAGNHNGWSWAPLTPDGTYAVIGQNYWGNTTSNVVGIDTATRSVLDTGTLLSAGAGDGLYAEYFSDTTFGAGGGTRYTRHDPFINFSWGVAPPQVLDVNGAATAMGGFSANAFSVRWSGEVEAQFTEDYTFSVDTTDGVRVTVDGTVVINQLGHQSATPTTMSGTIGMTAGERVPIVVEYVDQGGAASSILLRWVSLHQPYGTLPQEQLYTNHDYGLLADYYGNTGFTAPVVEQRVDPGLFTFWGTWGDPVRGIGLDNWSVRYSGTVEAPATVDPGAAVNPRQLEFCLRADGDAALAIAGTTLIDAIDGSDGTDPDVCATYGAAVTEGTPLSIVASYVDMSGDARFEVSYRVRDLDTMALVVPRQPIPSARYAPAMMPTHGVLATFYSSNDWNRTQPGHPFGQAGFTTVLPNLDHDWDADDRFEYGVVTSNDFSARFVSQLDVPCDGIAEFQVTADDYAPLWIDQVLVVDQMTTGTSEGAVYLTEGLHDFKVDFTDTGVGGVVRVRWRLDCLGDAGFYAIPASSYVLPTGPDVGGYVRSPNGNNGSNTDYQIYQMPTGPGVAAANVTADTPGSWGLASSAMMVPSFAHDGSKLAFIDGDHAGGSGWRKGLSFFRYDQDQKIFYDRTLVVNNWPFGDVIKWPSFESDSRSIIYHSVTPGSFCCRGASRLNVYGQMAPTNYFEDPGRLFSVDSESATPTPVELTRANHGERPIDNNKNYQATVLPRTAGGYRWAVFTSTRPYGNMFNIAGQEDFSDPTAYNYIPETAPIGSQLWVSAIDDTVSASSDRSHPAFWLPHQRHGYGSTSSGEPFTNERAFWVDEACRPPGTNVASLCASDADCCSGSFCQIDVPVSVPAVRHCREELPPGVCAGTEDPCMMDDECCPGLVCANGACEEPAGLPGYYPENFVRDYEATCPRGALPRWKTMTWLADTPPGTQLQFYVQASDDPDDFLQLPKYPAGPPAAAILVGTAEDGGPNSPWGVIDLLTPLEDENLEWETYLRLTVRFVPDSMNTVAPTLENWRVHYSCEPAE